MSALTSALIAAGALIAEEVLVTSRGGPALLTGVAGSVATFIDHFGDPTVPAIPNVANYSPSSSSTPTTTPTSSAPAPGSVIPPAVNKSIPGTNIPVAK